MDGDYVFRTCLELLLWVIGQRFDDRMVAPVLEPKSNANF
jgi:hypothetical protein